MSAQIDIALLLLRLVVGFAMFYHGSTKLFGWFGGAGLSGATQIFRMLGYRPPRAMAIVASTLETVGGVLLLLGLLSPTAVVLLTAILVNVIAVRIGNGYDQRNRGVEYELALLVVVAAIAFAGPGAYSLDAVLGIDLIGLAVRILGVDVGVLWSVVLLVAGAVGGLIVSATRRTPAQHPTSAEVTAVDS